MLEIAQDRFFPNGKSKKGMTAEFSFKLFDQSHCPLELTYTLREWLEETSYKVLHFYLATERNETSDAHSELPKFEVSSTKIKRSAPQKQVSIIHKETELKEMNVIAEKVEDSVSFEKILQEKENPGNECSNPVEVSPEQNMVLVLINEEDNQDKQDEFVPLLDGYCEAERREISISYSRSQDSSYTEEVVFTVTCNGREQCMETVAINDPEVTRRGLSNFVPFDHGFQVSKISLEGKQLYDMYEDNDQSLMKFEPTTLWGYDGNELILAAVSGRHNSLYTWCLDDNEIYSGANFMCISVRAEGIYKCLITNEGQVAMSKGLHVVNKGSITAHKFKHCSTSP